MIRWLPLSRAHELVDLGLVSMLDPPRSHGVPVVDIDQVQVVVSSTPSHVEYRRDARPLTCSGTGARPRVLLQLAGASIRPATGESSLDLAPIVLIGDGAQDVGVMVSPSADKTPASSRFRAATQPTLRTEPKTTRDI